MLQQKAHLLESDQREDRSKEEEEEGEGEEIAENSKFEAADRRRVEMAGRVWLVPVFAIEVSRQMLGLDTMHALNEVDVLGLDCISARLPGPEPAGEMVAVVAAGVD